MIITKSSGPDVLSSTYWASNVAAAGKIHVSCNAGAIRVLLPAAQEAVLPDMRAGHLVILSRGPWPEAGRPEGVELMFDDGSDQPFALHLMPQAFDVLPADPGAGQWICTVWTQREGKPHRELLKVCRWRRVPQIPCLDPWT